MEFLKKMNAVRVHLLSLYRQAPVSGRGITRIGTCSNQKKTA
jgi:hypothetical protein